MKDIFIDNNVAIHFCNPIDVEYKELIEWLFFFDKQKPDDNPSLVISNKLLNEYKRTMGMCRRETCIILIIDKQIRQGNITKYMPQEISDFKSSHFTKSILSKLQSNPEDRELLPLVLLSKRKYALSEDNDLIEDLHKFTEFSVTTAKSPSEISYK